MDAEILVRKSWFNKRDADGIPIIILVNDEVFVRCNYCKRHKHHLETCSKYGRRRCRKCNSIVTQEATYRRNDWTRKRDKTIWNDCPVCLKRVKKIEWSLATKKCLKCSKQKRAERPSCLICGKATSSKGNKYCSRVCMWKAKEIKVPSCCANCGKPMMVIPSRVKLYKAVSCSPVCAKIVSANRAREALCEKLGVENRSEAKKQKYKQLRREKRIRRNQRLKSKWLRVVNSAVSELNQYKETRSKWFRKSDTATVTLRTRISSGKARVRSPYSSWEDAVKCERKRIRDRFKFQSRTAWQFRVDSARSNSKKRFLCKQLKKVNQHNAN